MATDTRDKSYRVAKNATVRARCSGRMETGTRVNGRIALNTVKEQIYLPMEIVSQVPMSWASQKVKANISGKT